MDDGHPSLSSCVVSFSVVQHQTRVGGTNAADNARSASCRALTLTVR